MRNDLNKVMVERSRPRSWDKYTNYRNIKNLYGRHDDGESTCESMKFRPKVIGSYKSFNENLNPLLGWLNSCVGKNWDKCYSELRDKFDTSSVINDHIMQHLFDYIQVDTYLLNDEIVFNSKHHGVIKAAKVRHGCDFYVDPKTGQVCKTEGTVSRKKYREVQIANHREEFKHEFRQVGNIAFHKDGSKWIAYEMKKYPDDVKVVHDYIRDPITQKITNTIFTFLRKGVKVDPIVDILRGELNYYYQQTGPAWIKALVFNNNIHAKFYIASKRNPTSKEHRNYLQEFKVIPQLVK